MNGKLIYWYLENINETALNCFNCFERKMEVNHLSYINSIELHPDQHHTSVTSFPHSVHIMSPSPDTLGFLSISFLDITINQHHLLLSNNIVWILDFTGPADVLVQG